MIFAVIFLVFALVVLYYRSELSYRACFFTGLLLGLFFQWHLFVTIMIGCALLCAFAKHKKKTLFLLAGFGIVFGAHYLYFKSITESGWFYPDIKNFPRLNFDFPTMGDQYPFSLRNMLGYYVYAYGLRLLLIPVGLLLVARQNKEASILLASIVVPAFILINTFQLSPASVYDNHKWLKPMNVIADLAVAYALAALFLENRPWLWRVAGIILLIVVMLSGIIELFPFLNSRPTNFFIDANSTFVAAIRAQTPPKSSFIGNHHKEIQFAGRKVFLGNYAGSDLRLDASRREKIIAELYDASDVRTFCNLAKSHNINYVEFDRSKLGSRVLTLLGPEFKRFTAKDENGEGLFVDTQSGCGADISAIPKALFDKSSASALEAQHRAAGDRPRQHPTPPATNPTPKVAPPTAPATASIPTVAQLT